MHIENWAKIAYYTIFCEGDKAQTIIFVSLPAFG